MCNVAKRGAKCCIFETNEIYVLYVLEIKNKILIFASSKIEVVDKKTIETIISIVASKLQSGCS